MSTKTLIHSLVQTHLLGKEWSFQKNIPPGKGEDAGKYTSKKRNHFILETYPGEGKEYFPCQPTAPSQQILAESFTIPISRK